MILSNKKFLIIFLLILLLASFLRFQYLDKPLQRDEQTSFYGAITNLVKNKTPIFCENCLDKHGRLLIIFNAHTPLYLLYLSAVASFFNFSVFWLRISMVIFSVFTIILTYFVGTEVGGKRVGLLAAFILAITRLNVEHSQIIDIDGSFLTFFVLLSLFSVLKWLKYNQRFYFGLSILSLTMSVLIKESAVLIFPPLFIILFKKKKIAEFFYIGLTVFTITILFIHIYNSIFSVNIFNGILNAINGFVIQKTLTNRLTRLYHFTGIFTWDFTPPLLILSLLSIWYTWKMKNEYLNFLIYFVIFYALFFILILGLTRYFIPIIPVLTILLARFLLSIKPYFTLEEIRIIIISAILPILIFYVLKIRTDLAFLTDISSNFYLIAIPYIFTLIPAVLLFSKYRKFAIAILFGFLIGYNLYFSQEAINPSATPDFSKSTVLASEFIKQNSITTPIVTSADIAFFSKIDFYDIENPNIDLNLIQSLIDENKIQYVIYRTNSVVIPTEIKNYLDTNCEKAGSYIDKNIEILRTYKCEYK